MRTVKVIPTPQPPPVERIENQSSAKQAHRHPGLPITVALSPGDGADFPEGCTVVKVHNLSTDLGGEAEFVFKTADGNLAGASVTLLPRNGSVTINQAAAWSFSVVNTGKTEVEVTATCVVALGVPNDPTGATARVWSALVRAGFEVKPVPQGDCEPSTTVVGYAAADLDTALAVTKILARRCGLVPVTLTESTVGDAEVSSGRLAVFFGVETDGGENTENPRESA